MLINKQGNNRKLITMKCILKGEESYEKGNSGFNYCAGYLLCLTVS